MKPKKLIQNFYKSDALISVQEIEPYLHADFVLEWQSSKGNLKLNKQEVLDFTKQIAVSYVRSKVRIQSILSDNNQVAVRYSHFVKTVENPREEMLLGHFFAIWEIKEEQLYRGYQMSHAT